VHALPLVPCITFLTDGLMSWHDLGVFLGGRLLVGTPVWWMVATRTGMSVANLWRFCRQFAVTPNPLGERSVLCVLLSYRRVVEIATDSMQACAPGRLLHFVC
jgi:hypothetical protein